MFEAGGPVAPDVEEAAWSALKGVYREKEDNFTHSIKC